MNKVDKVITSFYISPLLSAAVSSNTSLLVLYFFPPEVVSYYMVVNLFKFHNLNSTQEKLKKFGSE